MLTALLANTALLTLGIVGGVVLLLVIIFAAWWIKVRNDFVRLKNKAEEGLATIDVFLKKRYDLIPNLVSTVKGYAKYEQETLEKVIAARNLSAGAKTMAEKSAAANDLTASLRTVFNMVAENYPQLQANAGFLDLQNQLKMLEGELEGARRYYNGVVKTFNTKLEIFPDSMIAKGMGADYTKKEYFELDSEVERKNVEVSF